MQSINLYTAEFRPRRDYLTLPNLALAAAGVFAVGLLIAALQWWHGAHLQSTLTARQVELQTLRAQADADGVRLAAHLPSAALARELDSRRTESAAKDQLLTSLKDTPPLVREGYAPVLTSLARHPLDGLWLTRIEIVGTAVNLAGRARRAELVPEYIDTLVRDADFGAQGYEVLAMQATEDGLLSFDLRSRAASGDRP